MEAWMARAFAIAEKASQDNHSKIADDERHQLDENTVTKSNALARSYYRFGLVEKRVMESSISMLNPLQFNQWGSQELELRAVDYAKAFNVSEHRAYDDLKSAIDCMLNRVIIVNESEKKILKYPLMSKAEYNSGKGSITIEFNRHLVHHLIGLREKFTSYPLQKAVNFSSSYTWRLYEIMASWSQDKKITNGVFLGWFTVSVDELRQQMGMPESYLWVNVERTLTKATDELWEKARIKTVITRTKTSRKITHLKFEFCEDMQQALL